MALSPETKTLILKEILSHEAFVDRDVARIEEIVEWACENDIRLSMEHPATRNILIDNIVAYRDIEDSTPQEISTKIFNQIQLSLARDKTHLLTHLTQWS